MGGGLGEVLEALMKKIPIESLLEAFDEMPDPRNDRTKKHELVDIIVIAICPTIAGAEGWVAVEESGLSRESWFRTFLSLHAQGREDGQGRHKEQTPQSWLGQ